MSKYVHADIDNIPKSINTAWSICIILLSMYAFSADLMVLDNSLVCSSQ